MIWEVFCLHCFPRRGGLSDLRCLQFVYLDRAEDGSAFVEAKTRLHKTRHSKQAFKRSMPLVSLIIGLRSSDWVEAWWAAGTRLGVEWDRVAVGPLVRAPSSFSRAGVLLLRRQRCCRLLWVLTALRAQIRIH